MESSNLANLITGDPQRAQLTDLCAQDLRESAQLRTVGTSMDSAAKTAMSQT